MSAPIGQAHHVVKQLLLLLAAGCASSFVTVRLTMVHPIPKLRQRQQRRRSAGQFWAMHDVLFEINMPLTTAIWCGTRLRSASMYPN